MNRKIILPDFGKFFRTNHRDPIDFVCRDGANLLHDFVYLRNYLHDADFDVECVQLKRRVLRIRLERDRWELHKGSNEMESISSELIIEPVVSMRWQSKSGAGPARNVRPKGKFFVRDIYLGESIWAATDKAEIVLSGFGRYRMPQLRIIVQDPFRVRLRDTTDDRKASAIRTTKRRKMTSQGSNRA